MPNDMTIEEALNSTFHYFPRNDSYVIPGLYDLPVEDSTFPILVCLIIFQMQTGFALVEAGIVRVKNSVNIMMKNIADVCIAGLAFWIFGFGLMFGRGEHSTPFFGAGDFFMNTKFGDPLTAQVFTLYFYQMSYATTSNTIVSGALAERAKFSSYCILTFFITILYSIGAGWIWGEHGWLRNLGAVDLSGGVIHVIGGAAGIVCAWYIGPRTGRYENGKATLPMGNPMNALIGMFILWWGWLAFNAGCPYGVTGGKWHYAARAGVGTALATWGAGATSIFYSMYRNKGKVDVYEVLTGILSALIMINVSCFLIATHYAILCGCISAFVSISAIPVMDKFGIDDPIGVFSVHWLGGCMGFLSVGLFSENPVPLTTTMGREGLLMGGGFWLFTIEVIAIISLTILGSAGAYVIIKIVDKFSPLRLDQIDEEKGCDIAEHGIDSVGNFGLCQSSNEEPMKIWNVKSDEVNLSVPVTPTVPQSFNFNVLQQPNNGSLRTRNLGQYNLTFEGDSSINNQTPVLKLNKPPRL